MKKVSFEYASEDFFCIYVIIRLDDKHLENCYILISKSVKTSFRAHFGSIKHYYKNVKNFKTNFEKDLKNYLYELHKVQAQIQHK